MPEIDGMQGDEAATTEVIDADSIEEESSLHTTTLRARMHAGPLPSPETLSGYENVLPGAAERIFKMAETQANHRREMENLFMKAMSRDSLLGILFAFVLGLSTIGGGIWIATSGNTGAGIFLSSIGLTGLAGAFIFGTRTGKNDNDEK